MLWTVLGAAVFASLVLLLVWRLKGLLLTPVRVGENMNISVRVEVSGAADTLEAALAALLWLRADGVLPCEIELLDLGMDAETLSVAEAFERSGSVKLIREGN